MLGYSLFPTGWGWMGVVGSERGVRRVVLPQSSPYNALHLMKNGYGGLQDETARLAELCLRFKRYLNGDRISFEDKLDVPKATTFQLLVWEATRSIPWGETRSYGWLAQQIGRPQSCRAVGRALASNPVPILVPCHRVVRQEGHLGGYQGGLALKQYLLKTESLH